MANEQSLEALVDREICVRLIVNFYCGRVNNVEDYMNNLIIIYFNV